MSSELSAALDAPRRALTATLNARLIARITHLIDAVVRAMADQRIDCPLMIVKGDGTLALAATVAKRPIETVLSGPAASVVGASWLSGRKSFIMSDMGGTTTDVGIVENGRPRVAEEGAEVGGWRTMVKAIDVKTVGLGGDSEVTIGSDGRPGVGPQRIVPVALLAARFPEIPAMLEAQLADPEISSLAGRFIMLPSAVPGKGRAEGGFVGTRNRDHEPGGGRAEGPGEGRGQRRRPARRRGAAAEGPRPDRRLHAVRRRPRARAAGQLVAGGGGEGGEPHRSLRATCGCRPPNERGTLPATVWSETVRLSGRVVLDAALAPAGAGGHGGRGNRSMRCVAASRASG